MPTPTGEMITQPEPELGRIDSEVKSERPSNILEWNRKMRAATQGMGLSDPLPKGFERLQILPLMWGRREAGYYPSGKPFQETTAFKEVGSIQLVFPSRVELMGGNMRSTPITHTLYMNGRTTAGNHINAGYTPEQCARAIIADPNWCATYVVWPLTAEEDAKLAGLSSSEEFLATADHRKKLMDEVFQANKDAGFLPAYVGASRKAVGSD